MKNLLIAVATALVVGCATLTEDAMTPIAISFSDGSSGECQLTNKRGVWTTEIPTTVSVRKSDDALKFECKTNDGREAVGTIASEMGAKIVASAVFIDLGITDAITDKHRKYADSYVIPMVRVADAGGDTVDSSANSDSAAQTKERETVYAELDMLNDLRERGIITDAEFEAEKKKILGTNQSESVGTDSN